MKTISHLFTSKSRLDSFVKQNTIDPNVEHFIQVFYGHNDPIKLRAILKDIKNLLPLAKIIATSTAGEIVEGGMLDNSTVLSITTFESTTVKVQLIEGNSEKHIAQKVCSTMLSSKTKLILAFNNVYANDGENFIEALNKRTDIKIAGGNAGDNGDFSYQTVVGVNTEVSTTAIAVAIFDSDILQVFNDYLFNWQSIGAPMTITKADKSTVYEINHKKAQDVYREFLGNDVADNLPSSAVEFPLIFNEDNIDIARAPVALGENGELIMAGHVKQDSIVKFGFGDLAQNDIRVAKRVKEFSQFPIESIFIYSCSARKYFFKEHLNSEFEMLQSIAPTSGFITYGEFFKQDKFNKMLNVSSTFIGLSEDVTVKHDINFSSKYTTSSVRTLSALTHLVKTTSKHIEEKNLKLNQFQYLIKEATLYSSTDTKGIITDVNQQFIDLSGYSREELIGKSHNIVRHPNMPSTVYKEMWETIQSKKPWTGIVKNKTKGGNNYIVSSHVFPILDVNGDISEYISIREDVTEEIQRRELLEGTLDYLEKETSNKGYILDQYEKTLNLNTSFFRIDTNFKIIHANEVFCNLLQLDIDNLIGKNISEFLEPNFMFTKFDTAFEILQQKGTWSGVVPFQRMDDFILHMDTAVTTIYNKNNELTELMVVLHDITELINVQQEIEETQKDVVFTMGAIGETRSKETGNHVRRVAEYSKVLALHYGLSEEDAELLKMASPMHDIGKVGIPDAILNKPGKFTDSEWSIMQTHSMLGYNMLKNSNRKILRAAATIAKTHHEKWDGTGYPEEIAGEDIHIYGRITAVADVFDALGSDRCYKRAWDDEKIFNLFREGKGKHFDPKIIDIFFNNLDLFLEIRSKYKDNLFE